MPPPVQDSAIQRAACVTGKGDCKSVYQVLNGGNTVVVVVIIDMRNPMNMHEQYKIQYMPVICFRVTRVCF